MEQNILGFTKTTDIMLALYYNNLDTRRNFSSAIAKRTKMTYSHAVKLIYRIRDLNLVTITKEGRIKKIHLTPKGKEIARKLAKMKELLK